MSNSTGETPNRRERRQPKRWQRVLFHWRLPMVLVLILMVLSGVLVQTVSGSFAAREKAKAEAEKKNAAQLVTYEQAVVDALTAEEKEVKPLVSLTKEDGRVTYDDQTDRVLLAFWTNQPEAFKKDTQTTLEEYTYAYADLELAAWGAVNKDNLKNNKEKRLIQLLGLPEGGKGTNFVVAWVTPERVLRAAYQPDAQDGKMAVAFEETADQGFTTWFDAQINANYFTTPRPWTRLGYTYDWGKAGDDHYGMTEFVIPSGTKVTVKDVLTNEETITRLRKGKLG